MANVSKRIKRHHERVTRTNPRPLDEALAIVKEMASAKFRESVDVAINLGIDASKSDQAVRGSTVLPNGWMPFFDFSMLFGHDTLERQRATLGLRVEF